MIIAKLEYGRVMKLIPFAFITFFLILMLFIKLFISPPPADSTEGPWVFSGLIIFFIILPWIMFAEIFSTYIILTSEGIEKHTLTGRNKSIQWNEIGSISVGFKGESIVFNTQSIKLEVSTRMTGLDILEQTIEEKLHPSKWSIIPKN